MLEGGVDNDTLIALGSGPSTLANGAVTLIGGAGNNVLIGTGASALADYEGVPEAVTVDLTVQLEQLAFLVQLNGSTYTQPFQNATQLQYTGSKGGTTLTTQTLNVPNPCTLCHKEKSVEWAEQTLSAWTERSPWRMRN